MIGNVVGNYKITAKIGEGGMGAVFKGVDLMLEREVAIKMLRPELASQPAVVERFRTEAVTLAKLNHPNIAMLHNFFRQGEHYFMVMEYVRGETLDSAIRRFGAMSVEHAVALFCQALEGIEHAHRLGIIHRDIKPANMMLTDTGSIKVMDFGIARVLGSARMTKQGNVIGTIEYMPPEQVRGEETDARSDVYSLGILLYEMLTGRVPFNSKSEYELMRSQIEDAPPPPRTFAAHIALPLEQAIMRSLAKRATARFQSAGEFRAVLLNALGRPSAALGDTASGYKAPLTSVGDPSVSGQNFNAPYAAGPVMKDTRLGSNSAPAPYPVNQEIKGTRLGPDGSLYPVYPNPAQPPAYYQQPAARPNASIFSNLNWKHYSAAAAAFVLIVSVSLAFIVGGGNKPAVQNPTPTQPEPSTTSAPSTSSGPDTYSPSTPAVVPLETPIGSDRPSSEGSRTTRTRSARSESNPQSPGSSVAAQPPPVATPSPAPPVQQQPQPAPASRVEKSDSAREAEKREEKKSDTVGDKVNKGISKGIDKIGGLFGKKKKDKKD